MGSYSRVIRILLTLLTTTLVWGEQAQAEPSVFTRVCSRMLAPFHRKPLVEEPVPGLYDSIPNPRGIKELYLKDMELAVFKCQKRKEKCFRTSIYVNGKGNEPQGFVTESFPTDNTLKIDASDLGGSESRVIPKFIKDSQFTPLVPKRGIPTRAFITMLHMQMAEVPYGGLKSVELDGVLNGSMSMDIYHHPRYKAWIQEHPEETPPDTLIAEIFLQIPSSQHIKTALTQSGHKISSIGVDAIHYATKETVISLTTRGTISHLKSENKRFRKTKKNTLIPLSFSLLLNLEPWDSPDTESCANGGECPHLD